MRISLISLHFLPAIVPEPLGGAEAAEAKGVPVFDFAETFDRKGLSPETALRHDGIHQMPETALYELYAMLDFVKEYHARADGGAE